MNSGHSNLVQFLALRALKPLLLVAALQQLRLPVSGGGLSHLFAMSIGSKT
jgi:hypothetical protein